MANGRDRNQPCPCNSGLKLKNCHGDVMLQRASAAIAKHMITLFTTQRMHDKGLVSAEDTEDAIKRLTESANRYLPECVELKTTYEIVEGEPDPPVDKLEEKKKEDSAEVLKNIQKDTELCPSCGRRLPAGMTCFKCNKKENKDA